MPIPPEAEVIGSIERVEFEGERMVEVVLDVPELAERFLDAYKELAAGAGWTEPRRPDPGGGFEFGPVEDKLLLCHSENGPALFASVNRPSPAILSTDTRPSVSRIQKRLKKRPAKKSRPLKC